MTTPDSPTPDEQPDGCETICGLVEAACRCGEPPGHATPHRCKCGGSWSFDADASFRIHSMPGSDPDFVPSTPLDRVRLAKPVRVVDLVIQAEVRMPKPFLAPAIEVAAKQAADDFQRSFDRMNDVFGQAADEVAQAVAALTDAAAAGDLAGAGDTTTVEFTDPATSGAVMVYDEDGKPVPWLGAGGDR